MTNTTATSVRAGRHRTARPALPRPGAGAHRPEVVAQLGDILPGDTRTVLDLDPRLTEAVAR